VTTQRNILTFFAKGDININFTNKRENPIVDRDLPNTSMFSICSGVELNDAISIS
jgi:hypothetical protein